MFCFFSTTFCAFIERPHFNHIFDKSLCCKQATGRQSRECYDKKTNDKENKSVSYPSASSWRSEDWLSISNSISLSRSSILLIMVSTFLPSRDEPTDSLSVCFSSSVASSRSSYKTKQETNRKTSGHVWECFPVGSFTSRITILNLILIVLNLKSLILHWRWSKIDQSMTYIKVILVVHFDTFSTN